MNFCQTASNGSDSSVILASQLQRSSRWAESRVEGASAVVIQSLDDMTQGLLCHGCSESENGEAGEFYLIGTHERRAAEARRRRRSSYLS